MKIASLAILFLALAAVPALAQYNNGPINGTTDAWTINFGYVTSDTFVLPSNSTVTSFAFGVWEFPGDILTSVDWSITNFPGGIAPNALGVSIVYGSGTASGSNLTDSFISTNQFGYNMDAITASGLNVNLTGGTVYWLNLKNAVVPSGDPVFWDENSGVGCTSPGCPSGAWQNAIGTIASEAFTITAGCGRDGACGPSAPEPSSVMLFGSGILAIAGALRRKLN